MFDLRLTTSLINFHLKVKKKKKNPQNVAVISRLSCQHHNLQEMLHLPIQTLYLFTTLAYLRKGKKGHTILELVGFFTLTGGLFEKVFKANEQHVRNFTTVSSETFILILSTSRTGCAHYFPLLPLAFLTLAAFSK